MEHSRVEAMIVSARESATCSARLKVFLRTLYPPFIAREVRTRIFTRLQNNDSGLCTLLRGVVRWSRSAGAQKSTLNLHLTLLCLLTVTSQCTNQLAREHQRKSCANFSVFISDGNSRNHNHYVLSEKASRKHEEHTLTGGSGQGDTGTLSSPHP